MRRLLIALLMAVSLRAEVSTVQMAWDMEQQDFVRYYECIWCGAEVDEGEYCDCDDQDDDDDDEDEPDDEEEDEEIRR